MPCIARDFLRKKEKIRKNLRLATAFYISLTAEDAIKEPESDYQEVRLLSVTDMQQALQYSADLAPAEHKSKLAANSKKRKHRNQNAELYPGKFDT